MSRHFVVEREDGITTIRLQRRLNVEQFFAMLQEVASHEISNRRLWDATKNFNFSADEIRQIARHVRKVFPRAERVAFVAADDLTFGQVRIFEAFRDPDDFPTRAFRDEEKAREWLSADED